MAGDSVPEPPVAGEAVRPRRVSATILDMVRSLGLLAVIVAVTLLFVPGLLHPSKSQRFQPASYSDDVAGFHQITGINALVPAGLGSGWYPNSARLTYRAQHAHLYIGWVTPDNNYLALDESNEPVAPFVARVLSEKTVTMGDRLQIAGATWVRYVAPGGAEAIARTTDGVTTVISGSGSSAQQFALAESLQSPSPGSASS